MTPSTAASRRGEHGEGVCGDCGASVGTCYECGKLRRLEDAGDCGQFQVCLVCKGYTPFCSCDSGPPPGDPADYDDHDRKMGDET